MTKKRTPEAGVARRSILQGTATALGFSSLAAAQAPQPQQRQGTQVEPAGRLKGAKEIIRITKV